MPFLLLSRLKVLQCNLQNNQRLIQQLNLLVGRQVSRLGDHHDPHLSSLQASQVDIQRANRLEYPRSNLLLSRQEFHRGNQIDVLRVNLLFSLHECQLVSPLHIRLENLHLNHLGNLRVNQLASLIDIRQASQLYRHQTSLLVSLLDSLRNVPYLCQRDNPLFSLLHNRRSCQQIPKRQTCNGL